jgi:hypothetical protein
MNFKTTIVLIIVLAVVGGVLFFTRDAGTRSTETAQTSPEKKLLEVSSADVTRLSITPADGKPIILEKNAGDWRLTAPITAPADAAAVDMLVDALVNLQTRGTVDPGGENASATGLQQPSFRVELATRDGKTRKLVFGNKSATGGNLYTQLESEKQANLVPADVFEQLDKPASAFRDMSLVRAKSAEVQEVHLTSSKGTVQLRKTGNAWSVAGEGPTTMPADARAVTDLLGSLTGLRAEEFVSEAPPTSADAKLYGLDAPTVSVSYTASPATTQPTSQPAITGSIQLGRYDDVLKKNVFAASSITPAVAKVPATVLESFEKTPLDFRDKVVMTVDPEKIASITLATDKPAATQPTSRPARKSVVQIVRRDAESPATHPSTLPATGPATNPATTAPTTAAASQPAVATTAPASKWQLNSDPKGPADDATVSELLGMLNPLRAEKFLPPATQPTTQPHDRYVISIQVDHLAQPMVVSITDPGGAGSPIAEYNGAHFEVSRTLLDRLQADFAPHAPSPELPPPPQ